jgi:hypothetical protein
MTEKYTDLMHYFIALLDSDERCFWFQQDLDRATFELPCRGC